MRRLVLASAMLVCGCVDDYQFVECGEGVTCAADQTCSEQRGCVDNVDIEVCDPLNANDCCELDGTNTCLRYCDGEGICAAPECRNGIVEYGEVCDDGNDVGNDTCRVDCAGFNVCDDGQLDVLNGEQCDDSIRGLSHDGCASTCKLELDAWHEMFPATIGNRARAAYAVDLRRGRVLLFGGAQGSEAGTETWELDGISWQRRFPTHSPPPRSEAVLAYDSSTGQFVLFGGEALDGELLDDTWLWDGYDWRPYAGTSPPAREGAAMAFHPTSGITLFGGRCGAVQVCNDTWTWDGTTWVDATPAGPKPSPRYQPAMALAGTSLVMFGGANPIMPAIFQDTWEWTGTAWVQDTRTTHPGPRRAAAMTSSADKAMLFGGLNGTTYQQDLWAWTSAGGWAALSPTTNAVPSGRYVAAIGSLGANTYVFGGETQTGVVGDTWRWAGSAWQEIATEPTPIGRTLSASAYDRLLGEVIVFGGLANGARVADSWGWDGVQWRRIVKTVSPSARYAHAMAYDRANRQIVLFGGSTTTGANDETWLFTDDQWTAVVYGLGDPRPPALTSHAMTYDEQARVVVLTGSVGMAFTTWEWDGEQRTWTDRSTTSSTVPAARTQQAMAYDPIGKRILMFGGYKTLGGQSNDTWEYSQGQWREVFPATPPPSRSGARMALDERTNRIFLYGGSTGPEILSDTWVWERADEASDGQWRQLMLPSSPGPARDGSAMAYDAARGEMTLFAGQALGGTSGLSEIWRYTIQLASNPPDRCLGTDFDRDGESEDTDGDGLIGCADPDCHPRCQPLCAPGDPSGPGTSCEIGGAPGQLPGCGDGACSPLEDRVLCFDDCKP